jgi:hypothetical protein
MLSDIPAVTRPAEVLLAQATIGSAVAVIDFLTVFSAAYDTYRVEVQGMSAATSSILCVRLATGGAVDTNTSYGYGAPEDPGMTGNTWIVPPNVTFSGSSGDASFTMEIRNVNDAAHAKGISLHGMNITNRASPSSGAPVKCEGVYVGGAVSGFRLLTHNGSNFTSGKVRVYGTVNS